MGPYGPLRVLRASFSGIWGLGKFVEVFTHLHPSSWDGFYTSEWSQVLPLLKDVWLANTELRVRVDVKWEKLDFPALSKSGPPHRYMYTALPQQSKSPKGPQRALEGPWPPKGPYRALSVFSVSVAR